MVSGAFNNTCDFLFFQLIPNHQTKTKLLHEICLGCSCWTVISHSNNLTDKVGFLGLQYSQK